jgi:hypothetical protein
MTGDNLSRKRDPKKVSSKALKQYCGFIVQKSPEAKSASTVCLALLLIP